MIRELPNLGDFCQDLDRVFSAQDLNEWMQTLLDEIATTREFGEYTYNNGLTLYLGNGAHFEITIVQSKRADLTPCDECGQLTNDIMCQGCAERYEAETTPTAPQISYSQNLNTKNRS